MNRGSNSAQSGANSTERGLGTGRFLGFPLEGFGFFTSLLLALSSGFFTFFLVTALSIFGLLVWNQIGGHTVDYADTYRYVGFPAGVAALVVAAFVFGALWVRAKLRN